jgi:hypothetical protein
MDSNSDEVMFVDSDMAPAKSPSQVLLAVVLRFLIKGNLFLWLNKFQKYKDIFFFFIKTLCGFGSFIEKKNFFN